MNNGQIRTENLGNFVISLIVSTLMLLDLMFDYFYKPFAA